MTLANGCKVWLALGADRAAQITDWTWTDVTAYVLYDSGAGVTIEIGYPEGSDEANPTSIRFLANNADGRWSPQNAAGAWFGQIDNGTPCRVTFNNGSGNITRATAYLFDLPIRWTPGRKFAYVPIEAYGILTDLESGAVLESNARRAVQYYGSGNLVAYWPCEEESGATRIASPVRGVPDATTFNNVTFAGDSEFGGSEPLITLGADDSYLIFPVPAYPRPSPESWTVIRAWRVPSRPASTVEIGPSIFCSSGAVRRWAVELTSATPAVVNLKGYDAAGTEVLGSSGTAFDHISSVDSYEPFGDQLGVHVRAVQNGTGIDWSYTVWRGNVGGSGGTGTLASSTLGPVYALTAGPSAQLADHTIGHLAVFTADGSAAASEVAGGGLGAFAVDRFTQQAAILDIPATAGVSGVGELMGYVPTDTAMNVLREPSVLDGGLLWENPDGELQMLTLAEMANQAVGLSLPYSTLADLEPTSAARDFTNRVTVSRSGGSSATADASGPLSPTTKGVVKSGSVTVNSELDDNLRYYAQWVAAVGTCQEYRYVVGLQFHGAAAAKLNDWLAMQIGQRTQITGTKPVDLPPETTDGYLRGYTERITRFEYEVSARLLPYRPYEAWTVEGSANLGRVASSGSRLLAPISTSATTAVVGTYGRPLVRTGVAAKWSTTSLPYDLAVRTRERVTATAVSNLTPTYVGVGTASSADYAPVTPGAVGSIAAGDCELLLAAVRDSGFTGLSGAAGRLKTYTNDQTGWTLLAEFGGTNGPVQLWSRTYQTGVLTPPPTIEPILGAAGDTVSAQLAAFRNVQPVAHASAVAQINASAGNIAYPGITVVRNGTVVILVVHKSDDWTSTTAPAGFTKIADVSSTAGSDHAMSWYYQIQTTATDVAAGTVTVSGGASAVSRSTMVSLLGDVQQLTLTRNVNGVTGGVAHPVGGDVQLWHGGILRRP